LSLGSSVVQRFVDLFHRGLAVLPDLDHGELVDLPLLGLLLTSVVT
jgi:hypothetical protein